MKPLHRVMVSAALVGAALAGPWPCRADAAGPGTQWLPVPGLQIRAGVHSLRALRYAGMVEQQQDFSCGAAALATILDDGYGFDFSESQVIQAMMRSAEQPQLVLKQGFSMLDMKRYVQTLGMQAAGFDVNMTAMRSLRIPVIVLLDLNGYSHFVVVKKVNEGRVFISDPALGNRVMSAEDFQASWNGLVLAVVGRPFLPDSPLLRDNVSRASRARTRLLQQAAPVLDYGLLRNRLF